jgi:hypothetical protein
MWPTWVFAVVSLTYSSPAISRFDHPARDARAEERIARGDGPHGISVRLRAAAVVRDHDVAPPRGRVRPRRTAARAHGRA